MRNISFNFDNVSEEDIEILVSKFNREIYWIASGARERYKEKERLEDNLKDWGRAFSKQLKEIGITHYNTSYSDWAYRGKNIEVSIVYTIDSRNNFTSIHDFVAHINYKGMRSTVKTIDEIKALLEIESKLQSA